MQVKSRYGLVKLTYFGDNCCCICEDGDKTKMGLTDNTLGIQSLARFKLKKIDKNFHYDFAKMKGNSASGIFFCVSL